ncbi:MAG: hypothetical protein WC916_06855 [Candidatus Woesearchaeota archaeon]
MFEKSHIAAHHSVWKKSWKSFSSRPIIALWIFLLDIGILASFILLRSVVGLMVPEQFDLISAAQKNMLVFLGIAGIFLLYVVLLALAYSFFKYIILGQIKSFSKTHTFDMKTLRNLFFMNLLLFVCFFIILMFFTLLFSAVNSVQTWIGITIFAGFIIILFLLYIFWNFMHSTCILGHGFWPSMKKSFRHLWTSSYLGLIVFNVGIIIVYVILFLVLALLFKYVLTSSFGIFLQVGTIVSLIVVYILFMFNRVHFYFIAEKHIGHKTVKKK